MALLVMHNKEGYRAWQKISHTLGYGYTMLDGRDERPVLAVPDTALEELAQRGVAFTVLNEAQLPDYLTPGGLAYYRLLRQHQPEHLDFNAPLPPALHVAMSCTVPEANVEAVRQIVQRHQPVEFRTTEVTLLSLSLKEDQPDKEESRVRVEFVVPRAHQQALTQELMASGAAGTSRATAIYTQSDPDGPPRGQAH
jgi:hypothetical protein